MVSGSRVDDAEGPPSVTGERALAIAPWSVAGAGPSWPRGRSGFARAAHAGEPTRPRHAPSTPCILCQAPVVGEVWRLAVISAAVTGRRQ